MSTDSSTLLLDQESKLRQKAREAYNEAVLSGNLGFWHYALFVLNKGSKRFDLLGASRTTTEGEFKSRVRELKDADALSVNDICFYMNPDSGKLERYVLQT